MTVMAGPSLSRAALRSGQVVPCCPWTFTFPGMTKNLHCKCVLKDSCGRKGRGCTEGWESSICCHGSVLPTVYLLLQPAQEHLLCGTGQCQRPTQLGWVPAALAPALSWSKLAVSLQGLCHCPRAELGSAGPARLGAHLGCCRLPRQVCSHCFSSVEKSISGFFLPVYEPPGPSNSFEVVLAAGKCLLNSGAKCFSLCIFIFIILLFMFPLYSEDCVFRAALIVILFFFFSNLQWNSNSVPMY